MDISTGAFYKWRAKYGDMDIFMIEPKRGSRVWHPLDVVYNNDRPNMTLGVFTPKQKLAMAV